MCIFFFKNKKHFTNLFILVKSGGMENPCLTFVTPTLLAKDRSLVDVVAHEISHSWMGNLVTTANWVIYQK